MMQWDSSTDARIIGFGAAAARTAPEEAPKTVSLITGAVTMLEYHPLIGHPITNEMRELVISRGRSGYLAMYSLEGRREIVLILRIRHHREAGYL